MSTKQFQKIVWDHYKKYGRHNLPWRRKSVTPYHVLVSEVMLQQTQADRVIPKYKRFLKQFSTFKALAGAKQRDVLKQWQGLGYNRRALNLKCTAGIIVRDFDSRVPSDYQKLLKLPGIGPYTASAIRVFAHNIPDTMIETNIRTVFLHHFFKNKKSVHDKELLPLIEKTLDRKKPREWHYALMDYGAHLKKTIGNPNTRSTHYTRQSRFKGSNRELRGNIVRALSKRSHTLASLAKTVGETQAQTKRVLAQLEKEGFVHQKSKHIVLA